MATAVREESEGRCRTGPALEDVQERLRVARRAIVDARHKSEDALADATLRIRRHPLSAVGGAAVVGLTVGSIGGFVIGYFVTRRGASA